MENRTEKIKKIRHEVVKTFFLLFIPHLFVCMSGLLLTFNTGDIWGDMWKYQLGWFGSYFLASAFMYIFAPKIVNYIK